MRRSCLLRRGVKLASDRLASANAIPSRAQPGASTGSASLTLDANLASDPKVVTPAYRARSRPDFCRPSLRPESRWTMMAPPTPQPQPTASSSSSSTVKHFERYFAPAEVEHLTTVARGKQSIKQAEGTRLAACAFGEFVGARLGL